MVERKHMNITKYNPAIFNATTRDEFLVPFDSLFDDFFKSATPEFGRDFGINFFNGGSYPKVDIREFDDQYIIEAGVSGMTKDDVSVNIENDILTITGNKQSSTESAGVLRLKELKRSSFKRSFVLSKNVNVDNISAKVENGVLTLILKKVKPIKIENKKSITVA